MMDIAMQRWALKRRNAAFPYLCGVQGQKSLKSRPKTPLL